MLRRADESVSKCKRFNLVSYVEDTELLLGFFGELFDGFNSGISNRKFKQLRLKTSTNGDS